MSLLPRMMVKLLTAGSRRDQSAVAARLTLAAALAEIDRLFGCAKVLADFERDRTVAYYTRSEWAYRRLHSGEDSIHMAVNPAGGFDPAGYLAQPRAVAEQIGALDAGAVLELGSGKGFNCSYLARRFPATRFTGIDLTARHVARARRQARTLPNLTFAQGDFTRLAYAERSFDLVFAVESLCHAADPAVVLAEIARVLRPGGRLVVFDTFRGWGVDSAGTEMATAIRLTEVAMAVRHGFPALDAWQAAAENQGLHGLVADDLTAAIRPNLMRLQHLALRFTGLSWRARLLVRLLPAPLMRNAIAGLLMPFVSTPGAGLLDYRELILERR